MKFVNTESNKHYRVNLERCVYYYPYDYSGQYRISFKTMNGDVQWHFKNQEERDQALEQLDAVSESQNISKVVSL